MWFRRCRRQRWWQGLGACRKEYPEPRSWLSFLKKKKKRERVRKESGRRGNWVSLQTAKEMGKKKKGNEMKWNEEEGVFTYFLTRSSPSWPTTWISVKENSKIHCQRRHVLGRGNKRLRKRKRKQGNRHDGQGPGVDWRRCRTKTHLAENDVLAIEPRGLDGGDEELGTVGVGSSVGHGEQSRL